MPMVRNLAIPVVPLKESVSFRWVLDESDEFVQCVLSGLKKSVLTQPLPNIHLYQR